LQTIKRSNVLAKSCLSLSKRQHRKNRNLNPQDLLTLLEAQTQAMSRLALEHNCLPRQVWIVLVSLAWKKMPPIQLNTSLN
jgi:hypothetical protein